MTLRPTVALVAALSCFLLIPLSLSGQGRAASTEGSRFDDLWWGVTIGGGSVRFNCEICRDGQDLGPLVEVSLGAYANSRLRVGIEGGIWTEGDEQVRATMRKAGVIALLTPNPDRGLLFIGGVGWLGYRSGSFRLDAPRFTFGAGWEYPFMPGWKIGNQLTLDTAFSASLHNREIAVSRDVGVTAVRFTVHLRRE